MRSGRQWLTAVAVALACFGVFALLRYASAVNEARRLAALQAQEYEVKRQEEESIRRERERERTVAAEAGSRLQLLIEQHASPAEVEPEWRIARHDSVGNAEVLRLARQYLRTSVLPMLTASLALVPELEAYAHHPTDSVFSYRWRRWDHTMRKFPAFLSVQGAHALFFLDSLYSSHAFGMSEWATSEEQRYWGPILARALSYRRYKVDRGLTPIAVAYEEGGSSIPNRGRRERQMHREDEAEGENGGRM